MTSEKTAEEVPVEEVKDENVVSALAKEKEKLLRDITELRKDRRELRKPKEEEVITDKLDDINPKDIALIEKVLKAKGYVKKDDVSALTYQEKLESHKDSWLKDHQEYLPENDPDDKRWSALNSTLGSYFKSPSDPSKIGKLLDAAHAMIGGNVRQIQTKPKAQVEAAKERVNVASKGTGGRSTTMAPAPKKSLGNLGVYLIGFDDAEKEEILNS